MGQIRRYRCLSGFRNVLSNASLRFENNHRIHIYMYIGVGIFRKEAALFKRFQWHEYALLLRRESVYRRNVSVFEAF